MSLNMIKELKGASPIGTLISLAVKQYIKKEDSDEVYRALVPMLHEQIKLGKNIDDPIIENAQNVLESLSPFGARRRNFKKWYIGSVTNLLKLPRDPDELSYGCWW